MAAAGSADGEYTLGALDVTVVGGEARVRLSGALAGSTLTLDAALRNVVQRAGWNLSDAVDSLTAVPARTLGLLDRGRIAVDQRADLVVLDEQLTVRAVMRDGTWTTPNPDAPRGLRKVTETL